MAAKLAERRMNGEAELAEQRMEKQRSTLASSGAASSLMASRVEDAIEMKMELKSNFNKSIKLNGG